MIYIRVIYYYYYYYFTDVIYIKSIFIENPILGKEFQLLHIADRSRNYVKLP